MIIKISMRIAGVASIFYSTGVTALIPRITPLARSSMRHTLSLSSTSAASASDNVVTDTKTTQTLIIGGGMAGTSAAFGLGQKGIRSIIVEQGDTLAPPYASSNGDSRMYRRMYSDEFFSKMQETALSRWRDVESLSGTSLLQKNGLLFYGEDTGETVEGSVYGAKQTMENLNLAHEFYESGDDIARAYPALAGCRGQPYTGVCEDTAGHIRASKACQAMVTAAGDACEVMTNTAIVSLDVNGSSGSNDRQKKRIVAVTADGTTITADHVVIAAGPWTNEVLKMARLDPLNLKVWEIQWGHYRVTKDLAASIPQAFHFRKGQRKEDGGLYYVFPASATECLTDDNNDTFVKVGVDFPSGTDLEGMSSFDYKGSDIVRQLIDEWVAEHLPDVGERIDSYTSPYTMTEDSYFVVDNIADGVSIFTGGSGRAFKFAPTIGDMIACLVTGEESPVDLSRFSAKREGVVVK